MKKEPLKGKMFYANKCEDEIHQEVCFNFDRRKIVANIEQLESAVEWLKGEVKKMKLNIVIPKIDKAFPDLQDNVKELK